MVRQFKISSALSAAAPSEARCLTVPTYSSPCEFSLNCPKYVHVLLCNRTAVQNLSSALQLPTYSGPCKIESPNITHKEWKSELVPLGWAACSKLRAIRSQYLHKREEHCCLPFWLEHPNESDFSLGARKSCHNTHPERYATRPGSPVPGLFGAINYGSLKL